MSSGDLEGVKMTMQAGDFASTIDHTYLKIHRSDAEVKRLCFEAAKHHFASVAVFPVAVPLAASMLKGTDVEVCVALGFHLGAYPPELKAFETEDAIKRGATEVDLVMNVAAAKAGQWDLLKEEFRLFRDAAGDAIAKIILETCLLTDDEKRKACEIAVEARLDYVKTSTGYKDGATVPDVKLMYDTVSPDLKVKASGGIRTLDDALAMIDAGASRLGTSAGVALIEAFNERFG
jgi:deoxyribose-phosphate aldolase